MTRYTDKQKLAAVTAYGKGAGGLRATASAHGGNDAAYVAR